MGGKVVSAPHLDDFGFNAILSSCLIAVELIVGISNAGTAN